MVKKMIFKEFIKNHIGKYVIGILAIILSSVLQVIMPKLIGIITDTLINSSEAVDKVKTIHHIYFLAGVILIVAITLFAMKFIMRYMIMGRARDLECFLRGRLFEHLQTLSSKFYSVNKTGDLMAYATNDLTAIRQAFAFGLVFLVDGVLINSFSIIVMAKSINPILTVSTLIPIVIGVILILRYRKKMRENFTHVQKAYSSISDKIQENISGMRVVKTYIQEDEEIKKIEKESINRKKVYLDYVKVSSMLNPIVQLSFGLSLTIGLVIGGAYVKNGTITIGDFIAFNTYLALLITPVNNIGKIIERWQKAVASIRRLEYIFTAKSEIEDIENYLAVEREVENIKGEIVIRNLNFAYSEDDTEVLKDINIEIPAGKTLAIVGKTGCGKTTLVNLLLRLYDVDRGTIFIDGIDIKDIPIKNLRECIGYVPQDNFLFSTTIKENIAFFNEEFDEDAIEEATKLSSVYKNIIDFPDKFDTVVGERGITLSGGQKQRISIARAIIKDPSILILDDSLSAVDSKTEEEIVSNIKRVLKDKTGILIAHRISTLMHADEIVVLDEGKIVERGSHSELINLNGLYKNLYELQVRGEDKNCE